MMTSENSRLLTRPSATHAMLSVLLSGFFTVRIHQKSPSSSSTAPFWATIDGRGYDYKADYSIVSLDKPVTLWFFDILQGLG